MPHDEPTKAEPKLNQYYIYSPVCTMEADVLNALQHRQAYFTGGRDLDGRLLIVVPVPSELQPWTKRNLELALKYLISIIK